MVMPFEGHKDEVIIKKNKKKHTHTHIFLSSAINLHCSVKDLLGYKSFFIKLTIMVNAQNYSPSV